MIRFLIPILIIGIAAAGFVLFTSPLLDELKSLRGEVEAYNVALNNSKELENERDKLTKQYNDIDPANIDKLQKLLPDSVDNIRLILEIEKIAMPYGMALRNVKYDALADKETKTVVQAGGAPVSSQEYGTWELAFSTTGTYANFVNFLKDLEKNLRIVDVSSVEFSSDIGTEVPGFTPVYQYTITLKTYWLKN